MFCWLRNILFLLLGWIATMIQMKVGLAMESFSMLELLYSMYINSFAQYNLTGIHFY